MALRAPLNNLLGFPVFRPRVHILALLLALALAFSASAAENINLLPKYGSAPKNDAQKAADDKFVSAIDQHYGGDRKKAAADVSSRGWQALRQRDMSDAIRRFNQAWLLDKTNGSALWGMAVIEADRGKIDDSLKLFAEAEQFIGIDLDFSVDYAKALGLAGAHSKNDALLKDAFSRFARLYDKAPQHTLNLQNWAITYFYVGNYAEAWRKIQLAEATPRRAELDPNFIAALQAKMPRP